MIAARTGAPARLSVRLARGALPYLAVLGINTSKREV